MIWTITLLWWSSILYFFLALVGIINGMWNGALICACVSMVTWAVGQVLINYAKQKGKNYYE